MNDTKERHAQGRTESETEAQDESQSEAIRDARALLREAGRVVVLTGAGISAESGVPTFRGPEGLWKQYRAEDLATPEAFAKDPLLVWDWYGWRRQKVAACASNAGHLALARYCQKNPDCLVATQNVDGLHEAAARTIFSEPEAAEEQIIALHGRLFSSRCTACGEQWLDLVPVVTTDIDSLPHCKQCGGLARPGVVWFGENLVEADLHRAFAQAELATVCLVVGTAGVVQPAASIAAITAQSGGTVIEINPEETPLSPLCSYSFRAGAAKILPQLLDDNSDDDLDAVQ